MEWCKLLLAVSAPSDPHAMLLWMDFLAIKSNNARWLLQLDEAFEEAIGGLDWAVGWQFAKALATRAVEDDSNAEVSESTEVGLGIG